MTDSDKLNSGAHLKETSSSAKVPGSSLKICGRGTAFTIAIVQNSAHEVNVTFAKCEDAANWSNIFSSSLFQNWAKLYEEHGKLVLTSVEIRYVQGNQDAIENVVIRPTIHTTSVTQAAMPTEEVVLSAASHSAAVIVMLRCATKATREAGRAYDSGARDNVLFFRVARPSIAQPSSLEIMSGCFDASGNFVGSVSKLLSESLGIQIHKTDLIPLTPKRTGVLAHTQGVAVAPAQLHSVVDLYLYRRNITETEMSCIPRASTVIDNEVATSPFCTAPLSEAWKVTSDALSIAAVCFFHEFRYHGIMPKFKPPHDAKDDSMEKRKPIFMMINDITPESFGVNLRVKVVEIVTPAPTADSSENFRKERRSKETHFVIGDESGTINLNVDASQQHVVSSNAAGNYFSIRNARADVVNSQMILCVDKWGKIATARPEDEGFGFEVNMDNKRSELEFELVRSNADEAHGGNDHPYYEGTQRYGNNNGPSGRGRGRGLGRGGGHRRGGPRRGIFPDA